MKHLNSYIFEAKQQKDWKGMIQNILFDFHQILKDNNIDTDHIKDMCLPIIDIMSNHNRTPHCYSSFILRTPHRNYEYDIENDSWSHGDRWHYGYDKPWIEYAKLVKFYDNINIVGSELEFEYNIAFASDSGGIYGVDIKQDSPDIEEIKSELSDIKARCEGEGIEFDPQVSIDQKAPRLKVMEVYIKLMFRFKMDKSTIKSEKEYHKFLPINIIDRFEDFAARKNMTEKDREELIDILKDGEWKSHSVKNRK